MVYWEVEKGLRSSWGKWAIKSYPWQLYLSLYPRPFYIKGSSLLHYVLFTLTLNCRLENLF